MITKDGYSKDPNIVPEGIVVTFGKEMIDSKGGLLKFIRFFEDNMSREDDIWLHKAKMAPIHDVSLAYIIVAGRLAYKCVYAGFEKGRFMYHSPEADPHTQQFADWSRYLLAGPIEKCPFKRELKGFQGFRYCTKLF